MTALRRLDRDKARPYKLALSPVIINLSGSPVTLLGPFEKKSSRWKTMLFINIFDGATHTLNPPTLLAVAQTFATIFSQYIQHPEYKNLGPDGNQCNGNTSGPRAGASPNFSLEATLAPRERTESGRRVAPCCLSPILQSGNV